MSNHEEHERKQQPPYLDPALVIDTRLREVERQQTEEKKQQQKYNRKQLLFNGLLVLFTALLVLTSIGLNLLTLRYVNLTKQSADAATSGAKTAASQLELAYRPWVYTDIEITQPLSFNKEGLTIQIRSRTKNDGNSPAVAGGTRAEIYIPEPKGHTAVAERISWCREDAVVIGGFLTLLPKTGEPRTALHDLHAATRDLEEAAKNPIFEGRGFTADIIVCTWYRSTFNTKTLYTDYLYQLLHAPPHGYAINTFKIGENIPIQNLILTTETGGGVTIQ